MRRVSMAVCALGLLSVLAVQAGAQEQPAGPDGPGRDRPRFPLIQALDADGNGELSTEEIDNAAAALKTLDKNADGKVTQDELRGPRPEGGPGRRARGQGPDGAAGPDGPGGDRPAGDRPEGGDRPAGGNRPSPEDFATRALENDADGDGKLSKEELQKMAEKMAEQFGQRRRGAGGRPGGDRPEGGRPEGDRPEGGPDRPE